MKRCQLIAQSVLFSLCIFSSLSQAQTLSIGSSVTSTVLVEPEIELSNFEFEGSKLGFRLAGGISGPLEFGLSVRNTTTFGPLGNVIINANAQANTNASFNVNLEASGVIGPVAAVIDSSLSNTNRGSFKLEDAYMLEAPNSFASQTLNATLDLSGRYRLERSLILDASVGTSYLNESGWGANLSSSLSFLKLLDKDDGIVTLKTYASPGFQAAYGALGFGYDVNRRDWPSLVATVWLGYGSNGFWPGLSFQASQTFKETNAKIGAEFTLEPYLLDNLTLRGIAFYEQDFDVGSLKASLGASYTTLSEGFFKLEYSLPVEFPEN